MEKWEIHLKNKTEYIESNHVLMFNDIYFYNDGLCTAPSQILDLVAVYNSDFVVSVGQYSVLGD